MDLTLSDTMKQAIGIAQSVAREYFHAAISPAHLLKALLHKDTGLSEFLKELGVDVFYAEEWAQVRLEQYPKASSRGGVPVADKDLQAVLNEADLFRLKLSEEKITPLCALAAITIPGVGFTYEQLKTFNISHQEILDRILEKTDLDQVTGKTSAPVSQEGNQVKQNAILKYCRELNRLARENKLDPVVGRDREIRMMAEILGRRSKPNVIITGEPGVGKTALVNGFTRQIVDAKVPGNLLNTLVFELDFGSLVAGASYKGEVEDRLKNILGEIGQFDKAILFIDDIHLLLDSRSGASGSANLLKPELDKGTLTLIGATSVDNYTRFIETDEGFNRKFERIRLEEPDTETCVRMLREIVPAYESHHRIQVSPEIMLEAVMLSKRYLKERCLPDAAIDLLDRSLAMIRMMHDTTAADAEALSGELEALTAETGNLSGGELKENLLQFAGNLEERINPAAFLKMGGKSGFSTDNTSGEIMQHLKSQLERLKTITSGDTLSLEKADLAAVVAARTGIPIGKVQTGEKEKLLNIESYLKKRVIGQDHGIRSIAEAIRESRSGLSKPGQPIGSFFFLGPTGTGKTELAKTLAEFLFNDESSLIRFDMSEFKEEHSAALLYGAPPGYVGYEEGGLLVNKIREKPYSIVLFDEIEKAHTSVFDIFLQILDEGKLHDRLGKEGDFSNAVILFTSNIGSSYIVDSFGRGEIPAPEKLSEMMENYFRPEFLGRLTEIIPFAPISEENAVKILEIHLKNLYKSLENQGIELKLEQIAKESLAKSGFNSRFGARPLIGVIRTALRRPLSGKIISGEIGKGSVVRISAGDSGELEWDITPPLQETT